MESFDKAIISTKDKDRRDAERPRSKGRQIIFKYKIFVTSVAPSLDLHFDTNNDYKRTYLCVKA